MIILNLGCGESCHPDLVNLDLVQRHPLARPCDLRNGIPYAGNSVDACYSSHVLEHLDKAHGLAFLAEQFRVLKHGGIIRVVVPDLEAICRNYLKYLESSVSGDRQAEFRYDYSVLEMFDQITRTESGGELGALWQSGTITDIGFVLARHGEEARPHIRMTKPTQAEPRKPVEDGEVHKKMYDRFSLARALAKVGFTEIQVCAHNSSRISGLTETGLDGNAKGPRKPDSLFMEASKK